MFFLVASVFTSTVL